jgi:metacaspase-1
MSCRRLDRLHVSPPPWALALLGLASLPSAAESRALLVGVGHYQYPGIDLPAIDLDLERMRETLNRLGFENRQIRTLLDEQATSTAVVKEFSTWLREGVKPDDRVVFYFSGHGSNVPDLDGDESDGADEVLVTHDMHRRNVVGRSTLQGVVTDDQIAALIAKIPSRNVIVLVDACHSGTVTRSFTLDNRSLTREPVFVKSFVYPGMPESQSGFTRDLSRAVESGQNFVSLTAAGDGEKAIGTMSGGIFTTAVTQSIAAAAAARQPITLSELRDLARDYIRAKVDAREVHTPQLTGSPQLATKAFTFDPASPAAAPNRARLLDLAAAQSRRLALRTPRTTYALEEPVKLDMTLPAPGYLNIVTVDADDTATVLFPNRLHGDNAVAAGRFTFPTADMKFDLLASEPVGPNLVVAFLSTEPINFYEETLEDRDAQGNIEVDFPSLSNTATRAVRAATRHDGVWAGQAELRIVRPPSR